MSKREPTPEERRWVETWRWAGPELERIRREELRAMSDARALIASNRVLAAVGWLPRTPRRSAASGLVEQQALLRRRASE
jgi:hypothetical protein